MATQDTTVTIAPYFKIKEGQLAAFKKLVERFMAIAEKEPGTLYYGYAFSGDVAFCREGYVNAEAALAHVQHVSPTIMEAMKISELIRVEIVGAEAELAKIRPHAAAMNPQYFVLEYGFKR